MMVSSISLRTALELCGITKSQFVELWSSSQDAQYVSVEELYSKGISVLGSRVYSIKPKFDSLSVGDYVCMSFKVDRHTIESLHK